MANPSPPRRINPLRAILGTCLLGMVFGLLWLVKTERLATFEITSASMEPALAEGRRLWIIRPRTYEIGDIVVLRHPLNPEVHLVKRLVAVGPVSVRVKDGELLVDGVRNDPPQGPLPDPESPDQSWELGPGEVFVVGDNRTVSEDSRAFGPVKAASLSGIPIGI